MIKEGQRHLGGALGSSTYAEDFINEKVRG